MSQFYLFFSCVQCIKAQTIEEDAFLIISISLQLKSDSAICDYGVLPVLKFDKYLKSCWLSLDCAQLGDGEMILTWKTNKERVSSIRRTNGVSKREQTLFWNRWVATRSSFFSVILNIQVFIPMLYCLPSYLRNEWKKACLWSLTLRRPFTQFTTSGLKSISAKCRCIVKHSNTAQ